MQEKTKFIIVSVICMFCCLVLLFLKVYNANAGCGCEKPAPPPAAIIPDATYPGSYVRIYDDFLIPGRVYTVLFNQTSTTGVADIDREGRKRIKVLVPETDDIGPAIIKVIANNGMVVTVIGPAGFTIISKPVKLYEVDGIYKYTNYKCAVDLTGTLILSFDLSGITEPLNFIGKFLNKELRISGSEDVVFYNIQGYLMTDMGSFSLPHHIPGLNKITKTSDNDTGSDMVLYWRHEFATYTEAHEAGNPHERDPSDPDYHLDGTPCIDHDHIIMKVAANYRNGAIPQPGHIKNVLFSIGVYSVENDAFNFKADPDDNDFEEIYEDEDDVPLNP